MRNDLAFLSFDSHELRLAPCAITTSTKGRRAAAVVHGNPTWSFLLANLVMELRDNYRCIVPDHIGCGLSDKPKDYPYTRGPAHREPCDAG